MKCPHCQNEINSNSKICSYCHKPIFENIKKIRIKRSVSALFFAIIAILSKAIPLVSIICIIASAFLVVISYHENKHLSLLTIALIAISCTMLSMGIIDTFKEETKNDNILVGTWGTLPNGGYFEIYNDNTYIEYLEKDKENNYCKGTYEYSYGFEVPGNKDQFIESDPDYNYYTVTLTPSECVIGGKKENNLDYLSVDRNLVFMISSNQEEQSIILNINTNVYNKVTKTKRTTS